MSQSTDGQICFGIIFDEGFEFPWDLEEDCERDADNWWIQSAMGFESYWDAKKFGTSDTYSVRRREYAKSCPCPFTVVNYCSGSSPMYILAVPSSVKTASRGYPEQFSPEELKVTEEEKKALIDFCNEHILPLVEANEDAIGMGDPKWFLSSYWG